MLLFLGEVSHRNYGDSEIAEMSLTIAADNSSKIDIT